MDRHYKLGDTVPVYGLLRFTPYRGSSVLGSWKHTRRQMRQKVFYVTLKTQADVDLANSGEQIKLLK